MGKKNSEAEAGKKEPVPALPPPEGPPVFGDPQWIKQRGRLRSRRTVMRAKNKRQEEHDGHCELWFVLEGRPVRKRCKACQTARWRILERKKGVAYLLCKTGHQSECLDVFFFERPSVEE